MKMNIKSTVLSVIALLTALSPAYAESAKVIGEYGFKLPGRSYYSKAKLESLPKKVTVTVPDLQNASASTLLLDGHSIKLFPGATFKLLNSKIIPLLGRFEFNTEKEGSQKVYIANDNFNAGYEYGHFLMEATPDNGVFFALKGKGSVWVKDQSRKLFEMKNGQQLQVPLFGQSIIKDRIEAFWGKEPSGYDDLGESGHELGYEVLIKNSSSK